MKKDVAGKEKGSTFAPAFGRNEGAEKRGDEGEKFFESLRPAQDRRRGDAPSVEGTFKKGAQENIEAEPEIQRNNLSTTILQRRV